MRVTQRIMGMLFVITAFCFSVPLNGIAQIKRLRQFGDSIPNKYQLDGSREFLKTLYSLRRNAEKNKSEREKLYLEFAHQMASFKTNFIRQGNVYFGWDEMEDYLMAIAKKVLPSEFTNDPSFKIYIIRNPTSNAFVNYDNTIYIHIGLIAEAMDEAEIAGTIAHEYGHLLGNHAYNNFVLWRRAMNARNSIYNVYGIAGVITAANSEANRVNSEVEADSQIAILMPKAGYSLKSTINAFGKQSTLHKIRSDMNGLSQRSEMGWFIQTHPEGIERANTLNRFRRKTNYEGSPFLINEQLFHALKRQAMHESIGLSIYNGYYYDGIAASFENYLNDTKDPNYVYHLLEGIRRWELIDKKVTSVNFLTQSPSNKLSEDILLQNIGPKYLNISYEQVNKSDAKELIDQKINEFVTYGEAFQYFYTKSQEIGCEECKMSKTLRDLQMTNKFDRSLLEGYLKDSTTMFPRLAAYILNGRVKEKEKRSTVINIIYPKELDIKDSVKRLNKLALLDNYCNALSFSTDSIIRKASKKIVYCYNYHDYHLKFNEYLFYNKLWEIGDIIRYNESFTGGDMVGAMLVGPLAMGSIKGKINKIDLPLLMPEFFEGCLERKVNHVHFISQEIEKADGDLLDFQRNGLFLKMMYSSRQHNINLEGDNLIVNRKEINQLVSKAYWSKLFQFDWRGTIPKTIY